MIDTLRCYSIRNEGLECIDKMHRMKNAQLPMAKVFPICIK